MEDNGPVLVCEFGEVVLRAIFDGNPVEYRWQHTKRGGLKGFAPDDKMIFVPVTEKEVGMGLKRDLEIWTDPGCDIYLGMSLRAGALSVGVEGWPRFDITDICNNPEQLLERGIETLALPNLIILEQERQNREMWGRSPLDPTWEPQHTSSGQTTKIFY